MAFVGLIPARGGSKGIPGKNIAPCAGKPLLSWTAEAARRSTRLDDRIVSTDSEDIARLAREAGVSAPFIRPANLALDTTPSIDVMLHALDWLEKNRGKITALVLLQPTSPLRDHTHIDAAIGAFDESGADTLVSVVEVPHSFHPDAVLEERHGWLQPYRGERQSVVRRQEVSPVLARNGPAILVIKPETVRSGSLYSGRTRAFVMSAEDSVDVDTPYDLALAEFLLNRRAARCAE